VKKLVLLGYGQSLWKLENKFTGWTDVDLSKRGIRKAHQADDGLRTRTHYYIGSEAEVKKFIDLNFFLWEKRHNISREG